MNLLLSTASLFVPLAIALATSTQAQILAVNPERSGQINAKWDGYDAVYTPGLANINFVGAMDTEAPGASRVAIIAFDLPVLLGAELDSAVLHLPLPATNHLVSSTPWFNIDVYGFTTAPAAADYFAGLRDESDTKVLLTDNLLTPFSVGPKVLTLDISAFLRSLYTGPQPHVKTVYLRFNGDPVSGSYEAEPAKNKTHDGFGRYRPLLDRATLVLNPR